MDFIAVSKLDALRQVLDSALSQGSAAWSTWLSRAERLAPANDPAFLPDSASFPPKSAHSRAKKSANGAGILLFLRSLCQKVLTGRNGTIARRYWGNAGFCPIGPGVKTLTPPHRIRFSGVAVLFWPER